MLFLLLYLLFSLVSREKLFFFKDFIYLFMRDKERGRDIGAGRSRLPAGEPDAGFSPRTLGSRPEPKADAQTLSHLATPFSFLFFIF